ncbi:hypothetical protein K488DRAFT_83397 [Vararia minispora EC-137]|uniref:Uncharacterized protein n=1 Tax=Vararia minispora EC-137 TaxID=1314806 RepID=A0ACB8QT45_9AGAM|nr:hypothetical protein K488DRAFT_83397 [Vararia minispora EC-137]
MVPPISLPPAPEERWVAQTRYMSIGATSSEQEMHINVPTPPLAEDESMSLDAEGPARTSNFCSTSPFAPGPPLSSLPTYTVPEIHVSGAPASYPTPAPSPHPPSNFAQQHRQPALHIQIQHRAFLRAEHDAVQTPPISTANMPHQLSMPVIAPQPQRARFRMGPRADCEMCRNGVKGHYAHFD